MTTPATEATSKMAYRFFGNSGLLVSELGLGSFMPHGANYSVDATCAMMKTAFEGGINLFDTAEVFGKGEPERCIGAAIQQGIEEGVWSREDLVITTNNFGGHKGFEGFGQNDVGLSRKHVVEGTKSALGRLQLDYVDVIYCHSHEMYTPTEGVVRAMHYVINQGWAFYWGTCEWMPSDIQEACEIADRLGLIRPIVEQPEYNIFQRNKVEYEYVDLYKKYKLGLMTWSPLACGKFDRQVQLRQT